MADKKLKQGILTFLITFYICMIFFTIAYYHNRNKAIEAAEVEVQKELNEKYDTAPHYFFAFSGGLFWPFYWLYRISDMATEWAELCPIEESCKKHRLNCPTCNNK